MNACCYKEAFDNLRTTHIEYECSSFEHFESQWYSSWWREVSHFTFWREMEKQRRGRWVIIPICYIKRNASLFSYKGPSLRFQITYSKIGEVFVQKSEVATRQSHSPLQRMIRTQSVVGATHTFSPTKRVAICAHTHIPTSSALVAFTSCIWVRDHVTPNGCAIA